MSKARQSEIRRLKYAATINDETLSEETDPDFEMQYVDIGNVNSAGQIHEIATLRFAAAPSRARRKVRSGDVIISTVRTYLQAIAPIKNPPENLIVSTGFAVVRPLPQKLEAQFCKYVLRESEFLAEVEKRSVGVSYPAINASDLGDIQIPLLPLPKQRTIADFLDRETARLDALMAAKERWLELLATKRRALITRAVAKGLNPNVPMKHSRIEWLGDIPAHWDASKRMKHVSSLKGRLGWQGLKAEEYQDEGPFVVSSAHFDNFEIVWEGCPHVSNERYELDSNIQLAEGDVLLMKDGAALGKLAYVTHLPDRACLNSHLLLFRPLRINGKAAFVSRFLFYLMQTDFFQEHITIHATGTTFLGISQEEIGNYRLALPPLDEQHAIVAHISVEMAKLDALRAATERTIALLNERRAAVITAAVTGKLENPT